MDLTPYLDRLREDLATSASAGDEELQRAATVLSAALEPAARLTLMNALADMAAEVSSHLDEHTVDVRLDGRDVRVVVERPAPAGPDAGGAGEAGTPGPDAGFSFDDITDITGASGDISRITLRIVEQIKAQAEQAAAAQGLSLNSFVAQAVQQALRAGQHPHGGSWGGPPWQHPGRGREDRPWERRRGPRRGHDRPGRRPDQRGADQDKQDDQQAGRPRTDRSHLHGWVEG
ncbi:hypothetical protein BJF85_19460 [Saccharomonospora sp. CUA-673]|uniref:toxin-antitoxin system HicB family antitoxin n=1 Tax=Saccharomonospora sp. CUA-673 TaxID=1904969 RepID=UPI000966F15C|nr:toxin-antitoxin system HicB family antitoxin [Saccharomonospora sp. CUA-673]OLT44859.1 hypothetical protein BJF85_19460 [Saccharomonospora sp. CUA-673]